MRWHDCHLDGFSRGESGRRSATRDSGSNSDEDFQSWNAKSPSCFESLSEDYRIIIRSRLPAEEVERSGLGILETKNSLVLPWHLANVDSFAAHICTKTETITTTSDLRSGTSKPHGRSLRTTHYKSLATARPTVVSTRPATMLNQITFAGDSVCSLIIRLMRSSTVMPSASAAKVGTIRCRNTG